MRIRLSVNSARSDGTSCDVLVTAQPGTTLAAVAGALHAAVGRTGRLYAGADALPDDAPLGSPPLVDGCTVYVEEPGPPTLPTGELELHVVGGPDAGGVHLLTPGKSGPILVRIGRSAEADIRLDDLDVSRLHVELAVERDWITVRDLGSTNGTTLDGKQIGEAASVMLPGALLRIGESSLTIALGEHVLRTRPDGVGRVELDRPARQVVTLPRPRVELPPKPPSRGLPGRRRRLGATYETSRQAAERQIATALTAEARLRRASAPDPARLLLAALHPTTTLWERRHDDEDVLTLRVGTARLASHVDVGAGERTLRPRVPGVPVTVPLTEVGVLGVVGPRPKLDGLARWLVAQMAGLHAPHDVEIVLLAGDEAPERWQWLRWLPHLLPDHGQNCRLLIGLDAGQIEARVTELAAQLAARQDARTSATWTGRRTVVVIDSGDVATSATARLEGLGALLTRGPAVGMYAMCVAERAEALPPEVSATVTLRGEVSTRLRVELPDSPALDGAVADLVSTAWAERFARALAPLRERSGERDRPPLPDEARLLDLLGLDLLTPAKLAARWRATPASDVLVLGAGAGAPLAVDMSENRDVLVAGAPGSGVSELVAAMVCGMAATNRPDQLAMVLACAGGGSSLASCEGLPHVAARLRLDEATGGAAELSEIIADALTRHALRVRRQGAYLEEPPRLLLAIDDAELWDDDRPGVLDEIATLVTRDRVPSVRTMLGVTLRDSATVRLLDASERRGAPVRVALRMPDVSAARRVVEAPGAELISADDPGRGYVRLPDGAVRLFRGARVTGRMPSTSTLRSAVQKLSWHDLGAPLPRRGSAAGGPTDVALLVGTVRRAAEQLGVVATL